MPHDFLKHCAPTSSPDGTGYFGHSSAPWLRVRQSVAGRYRIPAWTGISSRRTTYGSYGRRHPCRFPLRTDELNPAAVRQRDRGDLAAAFGVDASFR